MRELLLEAKKSAGNISDEIIKQSLFEMIAVLEKKVNEFLSKIDNDYFAVENLQVQLDEMQTQIEITQKAINEIVLLDINDTRSKRNANKVLEKLLTEGMVSLQERLANWIVQNQASSSSSSSTPIAYATGNQVGHDIYVTAIVQQHIYPKSPSKEKIHSKNPVLTELDSNFLLAVKENRPNDALSFLEQGANIDAKNEEGYTAFHLSIISGNRKLFFSLAKKDSTLLQNTANKKTYASLLFLASDKGKEDIVKFLIKAGVDIEEADLNGCTALMIAAKQGFLSIVKILCDAGAKIRAIDFCGKTPLLHAASCGHISVMQYLIDNKFVPIEEKDKHNKTALLLATENNQKEAVRWLITKKADMNARNEQGEHALLVAVGLNFDNIVKILLNQENIDINIRAKNNRSALHIACLNGNVDIVKELLDYQGVDIEIETDDGWTPLHCAASKDHDDIVLYLLDRCANFEAKNHEGETPLHLTAFYNSLNTATLLLNKKVNIDPKKNKSRETPLHLAARGGFKDMVALLIKSGADVTLKTNDFKKTSLELAQENGFNEIVELLSSARQETTSKGDKAMPKIEMRSELDNDKRITNDNWVLNMARKVDKGNVQHVFLFLEGIKDDKRCLYYFDLVTEDGGKTGIIQTEKIEGSEDQKIWEK